MRTTLKLSGYEQNAQDLHGQFRARCAMNRKIFFSALISVALAALSACNGIDKLPGSGSSGGALTVQIVQAPPAVVTAGGTADLAANVLNDKANAGVTWSCAPANACGSFSPATTGYQITTVYTAPAAPANGPITPNLAYTVTITATSVSDTTQSASATINVAQQYAFILGGGYGGWGVAGSFTLDGNGNVLGGEADFECPGCGGTHFVVDPTSTAGSGSSYSLDATGHGYLSLSLSGDVEVHGITATSNSHLVIAEEDQNDGITLGSVGSMDLQTAGPNFSGAEVIGGYSFVSSGYSGAMGQNGSWGGIFVADGTAATGVSGNITSGIFDENVGNNGGGAGYNSEPPVAGGTGAVGAAGLPITGTYTAPDANGRGTITLNATPDTIVACATSATPTTCTQTQYVYYLVTPEVLRLVVLTNNGDGAYTGSAYGQGSLVSAANDINAALTGGFIFSYFGYGDNNNGGDSSAAAGQFIATGLSGSGNVTGGIMDFNVADGGTPDPTTPATDISLAGSTIAISGSPRGTFTDPSGQIYNVYLTDPNLNLLDPNNPGGAGGALLFEANNTSATTAYGNAIGVMIPQADAAAATLAGSYAILFSQQSNVSNCCANDSGYTGDFTVSTAAPGTFSGEGDFESAASYSTAAPATGPLSGTFTADLSNPGRFTGTITTTPPFPVGPFGSTTPGTEQFSYYLANGSQGFMVETDTVAPTFGVVEAQGTISTPAETRTKPLSTQQQHSHPKKLLQTTGEQRGRSGQAGSGRE
jgi:hypothetical protein